MEFLKRVDYFRRFSSLFIAVSVVLIGFSLGVVYVEQVRYKDEIDLDKSVHELRLKQERFNSEMTHFESLLSAVQGNRFFKNYLHKPSSHNYHDAADFFYSLCMGDKQIMQLRYIDERGYERIRIDRDVPRDPPKLVAADALQDKSHRDYFREANDNAPGELYLSRLDLNVEHGKIEVPHKPVLRFALPVFADEVRRGIVIVNVFMEQTVKDLVNSQLFNMYLYDKDGCVLYTNDPKTTSWQRDLNEPCGFDGSKLLRTIPLLEEKNVETMRLGLIAHKPGNWQLGYVGRMMLLLGLVVVPLSFIMAHFLAKIPKRLFDELEEQQKMLLQKSKLAAMGEMIGAIAHQWRQPLNAVGVLAQEIQLKSQYGALEKEEVGQLTDEMQEYLEYMSQTIDDFRNFFKPSKQKVPFDVVKAIDDSLVINGKQLENRGIDVHFDKQCDDAASECDDHAYMIDGYESEFKQVIINIINNAREAIEEHSANVDLPKKEIRITVIRTSDDLIVRVRDNGGGIKEELIDQIFDPYLSTKYEQQGTGLGLYMSKLIIERNMLGRLSARNVPHGAEFEIVFHAG
jgi:two-component system, sporulation sensor kinase D